MSIGKRDDRSTPSSKEIHGTAELAWREPGSITSLTPEWREAPRWLLGGGSKKRAFIGAREAASAESEFFVRVEAEFALWEMLVRERNLTEATTIARRLARDFPENRKLVNFLKATEPTLHP